MLDEHQRVPQPELSPQSQPAVPTCSLSSQDLRSSWLPQTSLAISFSDSFCCGAERDEFLQASLWCVGLSFACGVLQSMKKP